MCIPLAMTELLSRHCKLLNFPVFSPPFNSCRACASCSTSVPRMHLSDCSQSLGTCCAGAGLPKGSTNVWGLHLKLSDSLECTAEPAEIRAMVQWVQSQEVCILLLAPLLISCSIAHFIFTVGAFNDTFSKQERNMKRDSSDGFNNIFKGFMDLSL